MHFSTQVQAAIGCGSKIATKCSKLVCSDYIQIEGTIRPDFIRSFLGVHDLSDQFSPGVYSGPTFRLHWTGSTYMLSALSYAIELTDFVCSGSKTGATTIDNDHQFGLASAALLLQDKAKCQVRVEFDVDTIDGYRIRARVSLYTQVLCLSTDISCLANACG